MDLFQYTIDWKALSRALISIGAGLTGAMLWEFFAKRSQEVRMMSETLRIEIGLAVQTLEGTLQSLEETKRSIPADCHISTDLYQSLEHRRPIRCPAP
jgi:hypothetical protein